MPVSFDDLNLVRWARSASGLDVTDTAEVLEPPGASKDTGWTNGGSSDVFYRVWVNWLFQQLGKSIEYLTDALDYHQLGGAQLAREGKGGNTANATGTTGTTTVTAHQILLNGKLYDVPQSVISSPSQGTLPTMHRIIVSRLVGSTMTVLRVDGSVDATDPTLNTDDVPLWRIVQAQGSSSYTLENLRRWGSHTSDTLVAEETLRAGPVGDEGLTWDDDNDAGTFGGDWSIARPIATPSGTPTNRYRRAVLHGSACNTISGSPARGTTGVSFSAGTEGVIYCPSEFPPGSVLTRVRVHYSIIGVQTDQFDGGSQVRVGQSASGTPTNTYNFSIPTSQSIGDYSADVVISGGRLLAAGEPVDIVLIAANNVNVTIRRVEFEFQHDTPFKSFVAMT